MCSWQDGVAGTESWGRAGGSRQVHGEWTGWTKPGSTRQWMRSSTEGLRIVGWFVCRNRKYSHMLLFYSFKCVNDIVSICALVSVCHFSQSVSWCFYTVKGYHSKMLFLSNIDKYPLT